MSWESTLFENLYLVDSRNGLTKPSKIRGAGFKMINMGELFANDRIYDIPMELVPLNENEKTSAKIEKYDLLFARQSLVLEGAGKCSIVMDVSPLTVFESHIIRVRLNQEMANPLFYYYYFRSPSSPIKTIVSQCAQAGIRGSDLQKLEVVFPPLETQYRIAETLSSYDSLIENNQKQIKLLEEAAQRLYKEWFVDLRFPGYEHTKIVDGLPEGWRKGSLGSFFTISIGKTPPRSEHQWFSNNVTDIPWVSISDMGNSSIFIKETSERLTKEAVERFNIKIVPSNTIFVSFKLTVGRVSISTEPMCTNEAIAHVQIEEAFFREYVYLYLKNFKYDTLGNTSSISQAINSKVIKAMPAIIPDNTLLKRFNKILAPIFDEIYNKNLCNLKLREARDRLLPKLMNGEIEL
jgi:type I restriction enzyme S subunit